MRDEGFVKPGTPPQKKKKNARAHAHTHTHTKKKKKNKNIRKTPGVLRVPIKPGPHQRSSGFGFREGLDLGALNDSHQADPDNRTLVLYTGDEARKYEILGFCEGLEHVLHHGSAVPAPPAWYVS